jgi:hypothetical protein
VTSACELNLQLEKIIVAPDNGDRSVDVDRSEDVSDESEYPK